MTSTEHIHCNLPNDALSKAELQDIERRMYPRNYSCSGFLAPNEKLLDVLKNDQDYLQSVNITYEQIVDKLTLIIESYYKVLHLAREETDMINNGSLESSDAKYSKLLSGDKYDRHVQIGDYIVSSVTWGGAQQCPFQNKNLDNKYHGYSYGDTDITITSRKTSESITFNTLLLHMIKSHRFFEGSVDHRLDPATVVNFFGLEPNVSYAPTYIQRDVNEWSFSGSSHFSDNTRIFVEFLDKHSCAHQKIQISHGKTGDVLIEGDVFLIFGDICTEDIKNCNSFEDYRRKYYKNLNKLRSENNKNCKSRENLSKIAADAEITAKIDDEKQKMQIYKDVPTLTNIGEMHLYVMITHHKGERDGKYDYTYYRCNPFGAELRAMFSQKTLSYYHLRSYQRSEIVLDF